MSDLVREMGNKAEAAREKMVRGNHPSVKRMNLTGKNAIVEPGGQIFIRLLPRWDIKSVYIKEGDRWGTNPDYKSGSPFFQALEHWICGWMWCLRTYDKNALCPLCQASRKLRESPDPQDRECGWGLASREVFLFNAVARNSNTGRCALTDARAPDIGVFCAQKTIFAGISNIMTGGKKNEFARGDITNPRHGYDIKLTRPAEPGDRWKVECVPEPSPIFEDDEKAAWKDWPSLLIDLPAWVALGKWSYSGLDHVYLRALKGFVPLQ